MTTPLERSLATTLEAEVLAAVEPDPEFFVAVHRRVRRRRRRRVLVAGCAAVLALAAGATAVVAAGNVDRTDQVPNVAASTEPPKLPDIDMTKLPDFANLTAPGEAWPDAVATLPNRLPDGGIYRIVAMLPDNRYLVLTGPKPANFQDFPANGFLDAKVAIFDAGRNTVTVLTDPNASAGTSSYFNVYAGTVGDHAMWYAYATRDQKEEREIWSAPLSGGSPRKLVTLTADEPTDVADAFSVTHSGVVWRLPTPGFRHGPGQSDERKTVGFYRIGPTGGTPELVPGSEGFTPAAVAGWFTSDRELANGNLWNLTTGERRAWTRNPAVVEMRCGPLWCGGNNATGRPVMQKLDGSGYVELPTGSAISPTSDGRMAYYTYKQTQQGSDNVVWDMSTGRAATFPVFGSSSPVSRGGGRDFTAWEQDGKVILLNFLKIK
ncbi:hypothetical protein [Virgisporangium aurantiacum]|uniref:Uncharacterized protein n=1 Tax=Virgisporangium aurantiacum TaxID=175570 RepID=A0A8J3ZJZ6_9ACTN|nr:hypothetical protein [Virgisporangium aurantiacum]GIJ64203.1 hypothetical protein Vau01_117190 [Virgisporangium aurantiacum]